MTYQKISVFLLVMCWALLSEAQPPPQVVNKGVVISSGADAIFSFPGDYIDQSEGTPGSTDSRLRGEGTIFIGGDLRNDSLTTIASRITNLVFNFQGGNQSISGNKIVFGGIVANHTGTLTMSDTTSIIIRTNLNLMSGVFDVGNDTLTFVPLIDRDSLEDLPGGIANPPSSFTANPDLVLGENPTRRIIGGNGAIAFDVINVPSGTIDNYLNLGLGWRVVNPGIGGDYFRRFNIQYNVANDENINRSFLFVPTSTSEVDSLTFRYFDQELNGIPENELALYASVDNGNSWRRLEGVPDPAENYVKIVNDSIIMQGGDTTIFTLANRVCTTLPSVDFTANSSNSVLNDSLDICVNDALMLVANTGADISFYQWTGFREGAPDTVVVRDNLDFTNIEQEDQGWYHLFFRNEKGCENVDSVYINVRPLPVADFGIAEDPFLKTICQGQIINFGDSTDVILAESLITAYEWDFGDGNGSDEANPSNLYVNSGQFNPSLIVTSEFGCVSDEALFNVTIGEDVAGGDVADLLNIHALPIVDFDLKDRFGQEFVSTLVSCERDSILFMNNSTFTEIVGGVFGADDLDHVWEFGDDSISNEINPYYDYPNAGSYSIKLIVERSLNAQGCINSDSVMIDIFEKPDVAFTTRIGDTDTLRVCEGSFIDFVNDSDIGDGSALEYLWDFGDSDTSTEENPSHQYNTPGAKTVKLLVTSVLHRQCADSLTRVIMVDPSPVPDFSFPMGGEAICQDETAFFINGSDISDNSVIDYIWAFGDADSLRTNQDTIVFHDYSFANLNFNVSLTATSDRGCPAETSNTLTVNPIPNVNFNFQNMCDASAITFTEQAEIAFGQTEQYLWSFGDLANTTSEEANPSFEYPEPGFYDVILKVTSEEGMCMAETDSTVRVFENPIFSLGGPLISCVDSLVIDPRLTGSFFLPEGTTYEWTQNGIVISNDSILIARNGGFYTLAVETPNNCSFSTSVSTAIFSPIELGVDRVSCEPISLTADDNSQRLLNTDNNTFRWERNGDFFSNDNTITITESGMYEAMVTRSVNGVSCISIDSVTVDIIPNPNLDLGIDRQACIGEVVTLESNLMADSYTWTNLTLGEIVGGNNPTLGVSEAGIYQLEVMIGQCRTSDAVEVMFNVLPNVSFSPSVTSVCDGESVSFENFSFIAGDNSIPVTGYSWDFGDGETSTEINPDHIFTRPGNFEVFLTVTSQAGCSSTDRETIIVQENPVANFSVNNACQEDNIVLVNNSTTGATYSWNFGDGDTSEEFQPVKSYNLPGFYEVSLVVNNNGCRDSTGMNVQIYPTPDLNFDEELGTCGNSLVIDPGSIGTSYRWFDALDGTTLVTTQQFTATTDVLVGLEVTNANNCVAFDTVQVRLNTAVIVDLGADTTVCGPYVLDAGFVSGGTYSWSTGESTRRITVSESGLYEVMVTDGNDCDAVDEVMVEILDQPVVSLPTSFTICSGETAILSIDNPDGFDVLWSTNETSNSIQVTEAGDYNVQLSNGICNDIAFTEVIVISTPAVDISPVQACINETIAFSNSTIQPGFSHLWNFGDGTFSNLENPDKIYSIPGNYEVSLTISNGGMCSVTDQVNVSIGDLPSPNFRVADACVDELVTFENITLNPELYSFSWDFGNGETSNELNGITTYNEPRNYFVSLTATTSDNCSSEIVRQIQIGSFPVAVLPDSVDRCDDQVILDAFNIGSTYLWSDNSNEQTLTVNRGDGGLYTVQITNEAGCTLIDSTFVSFNEVLNPDLGTDRRVCGSANLSPQIEASAYRWSTGESTPTIDVTESGTYWVQVFSADNCDATDTVQVIIDPLPDFTIEGLSEVCSGEIVSLSVQGARENVTYLWSTDETSPSIEVTTTGDYEVTVTNEFGCTTTRAHRVFFNEVPIDALPETISACDFLELDALNFGDSYLWSTGATTRTIIVNESGSYSVTITNAQECSITETVEVTIHALPEFDLGNDLTICEGTTVILDAGIEDVTYLWSTGETTRQITVGSAGVYSVEVINQNECSSVDQLTVTVLDAPDLDLGDDILRCLISDEDNSVTLRTGLTGLEYQWGSSIGVTGNADTLVADADGRYWVTVTDLAGCQASDTIRVSSTDQSIEALFLMPTEVVIGELVHFVQLTDPEPVSFVWDFGDGGQSTQKDPIRRFREVGTFPISLTVSNGACTNTLTKELSVVARESREEEEVEDLKASFFEIIKADLYPNPAKNQVFVDLELSKEVDVRLRIFDLTGKVMETHVIRTDQQLMRFNTDTFSSGVYLMVIEAAGRIEKRRFIINKGI